MQLAERSVTVLVTLSVPDAATLIAVAADSAALTVVHTTGVEGHLPLPGSTVLRGRQQRPWLVQSVTATTAILTDLALHAWDVRVALDPRATIATTSATVLLEHFSGDLGSCWGSWARPRPPPSRWPWIWSGPTWRSW